MNKFLLKIVTPNEVVFENNVLQITFKTSSEERGLLPNHVAFLGVLKSHVMKIADEKNTIKYYSVSGGLVKFENNVCCISTNEAYDIMDVTENKINDEIKYWENLMKESNENDRKGHNAELQLKRLEQIMAHKK